LEDPSIITDWVERVFRYPEYHKSTSKTLYSDRNDTMADTFVGDLQRLEYWGENDEKPWYKLLPYSLLYHKILETNRKYREYYQKHKTKDSINKVLVSPGNLSFDETVPFVQKVYFPTDTNVITMGDIHGSVHELLRMLIRLVCMGKLNNDFTLKEDNVMVFTGDIVDRGQYGVECIYTILLLKLANWDRVFILNGNHEDDQQNRVDGFLSEFMLKYGSQYVSRTAVDNGDYGSNIVSEYFYKWLPHAIYIMIGDDDDLDSCGVIHLSHGGIMPIDHFDPKIITSVRGSSVIYCLTDIHSFSCLNWADFTMAKIEDADDHRIKSYNRADKLNDEMFVKDVNEYMLEAKIDLIIRGHQDQLFTLKAFPTIKKFEQYLKETDSGDRLSTLERRTSLLMEDISEDDREIINELYPQLYNEQLDFIDAYLRGSDGTSIATADSYRKYIVNMLRIGMWYLPDVIENINNGITLGDISERAVLTGSMAVTSQYQNGGSCIIIKGKGDKRKWELSFPIFSIAQSARRVEWYYKVGDNNIKSKGNYCIMVCTDDKCYFKYDTELPDRSIVMDCKTIPTNLTEKDLQYYGN
jgi:hypothetical protein